MLDVRTAARGRARSFCQGLAATLGSIPRDRSLSSRSAASCCKSILARPSDTSLRPVACQRFLKQPAYPTCNTVESVVRRSDAGTSSADQELAHWRSECTSTRPRPSALIHTAMANDFRSLGDHHREFLDRCYRGELNRFRSLVLSSPALSVQ